MCRASISVLRMANFADSTKPLRQEFARPYHPFAIRKEHVQLGFSVLKLPIFCKQWSKLGQAWQFDQVTNIITNGIFYFLKN